jgi:chemotaxis protein MotB
MSSTLSNTQKFTLALKNKEAELQEREMKLKELQAIVHKQDSITNSLENIVKNALLGFKSDELSVEVKNGKVYVSMRDKLLFKSGSADVEEKGKDALKKLETALNKNQDLDILIEGHTDNVPIKTGIYKDNWDLSVARATSIVRYISGDNKLNPKRVEAAGRGEYYPIASNETAEGRAKNRRTEIILSPKLDELMKILQSK